MFLLIGLRLQPITLMLTEFYFSSSVSCDKRIFHLFHILQYSVDLSYYISSYPYNNYNVFFSPCNCCDKLKFGIMKIYTVKLIAITCYSPQHTMYLCTCTTCNRVVKSGNGKEHLTIEILKKINYIQPKTSILCELFQY